MPQSPSIAIAVKGPLVIIDFNGHEPGAGPEYTAGFTATQAQTLAWKLWRFSKQLKVKQGPAPVQVAAESVRSDVARDILGGILAAGQN